jgi:hypothetical protein
MKKLIYDAENVITTGISIYRGMSKNLIYK